MSIFDEKGNYIPWGPIERVRVEHFLGPLTLPTAWLAVDTNGTFSQGDPTTTTGYAQLTTTTTNGAVNGITHKLTSSNIDLTEVEVRWKVDGLSFSNDENSLDFQIAMNLGTTRGARAVWRSDLAGGGIFEAASGVITGKKFEYDLLARSEYRRQHNVEFIVRPDRYVVLRENGKVVAYHRFSASELLVGQGIPRMLMVNRSSAAQWMRFAQITMTLCHY